MAKKMMALNTGRGNIDFEQMGAKAQARWKERFDAASETGQILMLHASKIYYDYPHERRPKAVIRPQIEVAKAYLTEHFGPKFAERVLKDPGNLEILGIGKKK